LSIQCRYSYDNKQLLLYILYIFVSQHNCQVMKMLWWNQRIWYCCRYKCNQREWIRAITKIAFTELEKASSCKMIYKSEERYVMLFCFNYESCCAIYDYNTPERKIVLPLFWQSNYEPLNDYKTDCMLISFIDRTHATVG